MPAKHRRAAGAVLIALIFTGFALVALSLPEGDPVQPSLQARTAAVNTLPNEPSLLLKHGRQQLQLSMTTVSAEHEQAVMQAINEEFAGHQARVDLRTELLAESEWDTVTVKLIRLVGVTSSANASASGDHIEISGTASDSAQLEQRLGALRAALPPQTQLDADIFINSSSLSSAELCAKSFAPIATQTIHFRQSSTRIRDSFYPILDRVIEFAHDCRDSSIAVIGYTDSVGEEAWNKQVSLARAGVVADYLERQGIGRDRLLLEGAGSQNPIGDNDTVAGRERNRRIEFELR